MLKNNKIINLNNLKKKIDILKKMNKKIVLCHGCFDIIHWGHAIHFQYAKKFGDHLVVSLTRDKFIKKGRNRPVFNHNERAFLLSNLTVIDYVTINNLASSEDVIEIVKPDYYIKGKEYNRKNKKFNKLFFDEKKLVTNFGGKIVFSKGKTSSSTMALNKIYDKKKI